MIQQVVARRNRVEHLPHGTRRICLVFRAQRFGPGCRHPVAHLRQYLEIRSPISRVRFIILSRPIRSDAYESPVEVHFINAVILSDPERSEWEVEEPAFCFANENAGCLLFHSQHSTKLGAPSFALFAKGGKQES
jgi:hypothetical protein